MWKHVQKLDYSAIHPKVFIFPSQKENTFIGTQQKNPCRSWKYCYRLLIKTFQAYRIRFNSIQDRIST